MPHFTDHVACPLHFLYEWAANLTNVLHVIFCLADLHGLCRCARRFHVYER